MTNCFSAHERVILGEINTKITLGDHRNSSPVVVFKSDLRSFVAIADPMVIWWSIPLGIISVIREYWRCLKIQVLLTWDYEVVHNDVMTWKRFPYYSPFARGTHQSPADFPRKVPVTWALVFSLMLAQTNGWLNSRVAAELRGQYAHCGGTVMYYNFPPGFSFTNYRSVLFWHNVVQAKKQPFYGRHFQLHILTIIQMIFIYICIYTS